MSQKSYDEGNALYLIPTPIGNMDDITKRSIDILNFVDVILCEDTRITGQLLKKLGISKKLVSSNEYTETKNINFVLSQLESKRNVGLVTDRGTPIISDPGYKIVDAVLARGFKVIPLPGANALIPALIASGIESSPFLFYGFLSNRKTKRINELQNLRKQRFTIIFYEAPHRMAQFLNELLEIFGDRKISVSREISKLYEEIYRGSISEVLEELCSGDIKGEFVVVVSGNKECDNYEHISIKEHVFLYLEDGMSEKEAMKKVAKDRNISKSDVYKEFVLEKRG